MPHPRPLNLKRSLIILLIVICVTVNVAGIFLYARYQNVKNADEWVLHTNEVIGQIGQLHEAMEQAIAVQRGYLLTSDPSYLQDYQNTMQYFDQRITNIQQLTVDNSVQQDRIPALRRNADNLRTLLLQNINAHLQSSSDEGEAIKQVRQVTSMLRGQISDLLAEENSLLKLRQSRQKTEENYYTTALFGASFASIIVLLLANGLILGLSARQRATAADLDETRERLQLAMRGTSDGISDWDIAKGNIYFSSRLRDMLGYTEHDLPNNREAFTALIYPDDRAGAEAALDKYLKRQSQDYRTEMRVQHKDGSWRWHLVRGAAQFDLLGRATRLVASHTDVTRDKAVQEHLLASNKELENFTYIASHDLRSPLVNLKGFASEIEESLDLLIPYVEQNLAKQPEANAEQIRNATKDLPQALNFIKTSVTKMEKLTRAILELSRVGRRQLKFEPLAVRPIIENCVKTLQHQIALKNVTVELGVTPDFTGDALAIEQVFGNILDNAIKYLDPARPGHIAISGRRTISETIYQIADNGRGIREEDLKKVFELFKRAGRHDDIPGEGMGMSYVQTILRRHGGLIWLESTLNKGTTFFFSVPHLKKEINDV